MYLMQYCKAGHLISPGTEGVVVRKGGRYCPEHIPPDPEPVPEDSGHGHLSDSPSGPYPLRPIPQGRVMEDDDTLFEHPNLGTSSIGYDAPLWPLAVIAVVAFALLIVAFVSIYIG